MKLAVWVATVSLVCGAAHGQQFDLICTGKTESTFKNFPTRTRDWADTLRVDLTDGRWCRAECAEVIPIERQDDGRIVFRNYVSSISMAGLSVNRRTGELDEDSIGDGALGHVTSFTSANCVKAPFTGFPLPRF